ncbi:isochorismatase family protein, partial [Vibrio cholerae O1 str. EM-1676A]
SNYRRAQSVIE